MVDIPSVIQSARHYEGTDDSLKDKDNLAWLAQFDPDVVSDWLTVLEWVRVPDRLIEHDRFASNGSPAHSFTMFRNDWERLRSGSIPTGSPFRDLFERLRRLWSAGAIGECELRTWDQYLEALDRYDTPHVQFASMDEYSSALYALSGTFFQALPYGPRHLATQVGRLGTLDQFYNNLRDLGEDLRRGIICFPRPLLHRFELSQPALLDAASEPDPRLARLVDYLICEFASPLFAAIAPLVAERELHPSWRACLQHTLARYARIEYVFRSCGYCPDRFSAEYWPLVERKWPNS